MSGGKGGGEVTVGYHYYMNMHFAIAHGGVDELLEIRIGDRAAWRGQISGAGSALVNQVNLFGGEEREGGVLGNVDFMPGEPAQPMNPSVKNAVTRATGSTNVPAYRGLSTLFFKGFDNLDMTGTPWSEVNKGELDNSPELPAFTSFSDLLDKIRAMSAWRSLARSSFLWSAMNPYFKPPTFLIRRVWKGWYPEKAQIGEDVNPVHIIYECLINKSWGLGYPVQDIDDASFRAAADVLFNEGFGLSMKWTNSTRVQDFVQMVNEHINANLIEDRDTGQWRIIMVRDNYNAANLFELNESNCVLDEFQRKTTGETINEVVVAYTRAEDGETDTVTVQDLANFSNTGQINSQKKEYPGIRSPEMAFRIALRDLNTLSKPVAKCTIRCNRAIMGHYPGDVVKINWPRLGLNGVVLRIGRMNLGNLTKGEIQVEAIEDVFGLPQSSYVRQEPIGWVDPAKNPEPVTEQKLYELSYQELYTSTSSADRLDWPDDVGFVAVSALAPNSDASTLTLHDNVTEESVGHGEFTPALQLTQATGYLDSVLHVDFSTFDVLLLAEGGLAWLGNELIEVTDFDTVEETITVNRALIDTVPAKHPIGETLWFYLGNDNTLDDTLRVDGEVVDYRLLTETSKGKLETSQAPVVSYTLQNRQLRPYRLGNLYVNGQSFPSILPADQNMMWSWSHRDRTQEVTEQPTLFSAGNIGPEAGVTYTLEVINEDGVTQLAEPGLATTQYEYTTEAADLGKYELSPSGIFTTTDAGVVPALRRNTELRFKLKSVRDGLDSFQEHDVTVERAGYGYNYGLVAP